MADYIDVAFWALAGGIISLIGGALLLVRKSIANKLANFSAPFAAGALLAAAFFDLLPEAVELNAEGAAFRWAVAGIVLFFLLEHYLHWFHHHHEHADITTKRPKASLIIIGDVIHNAIDGIVIGAAFAISLPVGIVTTIAVAAHEIPQEIGDFGLLLKAGLRRMRVLIINIASALTTLVAALYTFHLGTNEALPLGAILGLAAGLFIYIAASDLIPIIHEEAKGKFGKYSAVLLISGVLIVGTVTTIAHENMPSESHNQNETHVNDLDESSGEDKVDRKH
jgi:zinc and cadmium transporter